jgi:branched-chain amino acid transport system permease protein
MNDVIFFGLLGLAGGALYAMLATGLVCAFKGSGVINFAHGALAMYPAFTMTELQRTGHIKLPLVDILPTSALNVPVDITVHDGPVPFGVALALSLGMAALLGVLVHYLVFRPLRHAPPLGKVIGSLGVLLYLQGVALLNFGEKVRQPPAVLPSKPWPDFLWFGRAFPQVNLWLVLVAVAMGGVLWFFYQHTRFGAATRAAASNEKGAVLLGYAPDRLALANWVIAALTAGVAGILVAPVTGVDPTRFTLFVVPALGAALLGNLTSIPIAVAGGILLGSVQSVVQQWATESWFPEWARSGAATAVPRVVIALVLFLRGDKLPIRGTVSQRRLPLSPYPVRVWQHAIIWPVLVMLLASGVSIGGVTIIPHLTGTWQLGLTTSLILAILSLSYVVLTGYVGQISLAQLALAGTAAFVVARLMSNGHAAEGSLTGFVVHGPGLPLIIAGPIAVAAAVTVGLVVGLPALRIRGVQLAVVTIAAALMLEEFYFKNASLTDLASGSGAPVPTPKLFGLDLGVVSGSGLSDAFAFTAFVVIVLAVCAVAVANIRRAGTGRRFLAVRANERAAAAAGVNVARTKLLAFGISSALAGVAGVLVAFQQQTISYQNFVVLLGLSVLAFAYLGGITSINGAMIAGLMGTSGLLVVFSKYHIKGIEEYTAVLGGVGLILTAIIHPEGIAPFFQPLLQRLGRFLVHARWPEWRAALLRLGPTALVGGLAGWVLWTRRGDSWWMTALGAGIALVVRANGLQIARAVHKPKPVEATAGGAVVSSAVDGPTDMVGVAGGRG